MDSFLPVASRIPLIAPPSGVLTARPVLPAARPGRHPGPAALSDLLRDIRDDLSETRDDRDDLPDTRDDRDKLPDTRDIRDKLSGTRDNRDDLPDTRDDRDKLPDTRDIRDKLSGTRDDRDDLSDAYPILSRACQPGRFSPHYAHADLGPFRFA